MDGGSAGALIGLLLALIGITYWLSELLIRHRRSRLWQKTFSGGTITGSTDTYDQYKL